MEMWGSVEYPFIAITPSSTLTLSGSKSHLWVEYICLKIIHEYL